jgi:hypothetical protein
MTSSRILHLRRSVTKTETEILIEQSRVVRKALEALQDSDDTERVDQWVYDPGPAVSA